MVLPLLHCMLPGSVCLHIGKNLGMYVHGVVSVGRLLISSCLFNRRGLSISSSVTYLGIPLPSLWLRMCFHKGSWDNSRTCLIGFHSELGRGVVTPGCCQCLQTAGSYILSSSLVVSGTRMNAGCSVIVARSGSSISFLRHWKVQQFLLLQVVSQPDL